MKEEYAVFLKRPILAALSTFAFLIALVEAAKYFGYPVLEGTGALGFVVLGLISTIAGLLVVIYVMLERQGGSVGSTSTLARLVIKEIENCIGKREYHSAIILGKAMSRPFWLEGRYRERIRLGNLLIQAASSLDPQELSAFAQALVDDLGWTNVELSNLEVAKKNILSGIEYSQRINDIYMVAKGYRHLATIAQREGDANGAEQYLNLAEKEADKIPDEKRRKEMFAGIKVTRGDLCLTINDPERTEQAKNHFLNAKTMFEQLGDRERLVKTYLRLGGVFQKMKDNIKAYEAYYRSLKDARSIGWPQQICEIDIHLGRLMLEDNRTEDALKPVEEAITIAKYLSLENQFDDATELLNKIRTKKKRGG